MGWGAVPLGVLSALASPLLVRRCSAKQILYWLINPASHISWQTIDAALSIVDKRSAQKVKRETHPVLKYCSEISMIGWLDEYDRSAGQKQPGVSCRFFTQTSTRSEVSPHWSTIRLEPDLDWLLPTTARPTKLLDSPERLSCILSTFCILPGAFRPFNWCPSDEVSCGMYAMNAPCPAPQIISRDLPSFPWMITANLRVLSCHKGKNVNLSSLRWFRMGWIAPIAPTNGP
jgi:hypothetical protein